MSKHYEPELGQAVFGQPYKAYYCPEWLMAMLEYLRAEMDRVMWNINQKEYDSPFANTGNSFKNDVFEVQAYSWDDDELQPYNFKCDDLEVSWYKYFGRGCSVNQVVKMKPAWEKIEKCLESLRQMEREDNKKKGFDL